MRWLFKYFKAFQQIVIVCRRLIILVAIDKIHFIQHLSNLFWIGKLFLHGVFDDGRNEFLLMRGVNFFNHRLWFPSRCFSLLIGLVTFHDRD